MHKASTARLLLPKVLALTVTYEYSVPRIPTPRITAETAPNPPSNSSRTTNHANLPSRRLAIPLRPFRREPLLPPQLCQLPPRLLQPAEVVPVRRASEMSSVYLRVGELRWADAVAAAATGGRLQRGAQGEYAGEGGEGGGEEEGEAAGGEEEVAGVSCE